MVKQCKKGYVQDNNKCRLNKKINWRTYVKGDKFAEMMVGDFVRKGISPEESLEIYVNSVEGDGSQLPSKLEEYALERGWLEGY